MSELSIQETPTRLRLTAARPIVDILREQFKYRPPDYWRSPGYQRFKSTQMRPEGPVGWDGYNHLIELNGATCTMLRGHKEVLLTACEEIGIKVRGTYLNSPFVGLTEDDIAADVIAAPFPLDIHQQQCVVSLLRAGVGVVKMAVNSGKTATFAACAALIKARLPSARFLYVTPTERLVNQATTELRKFLPKWQISQAGGGKRDLTGRDMVVATMATLSSGVVELHTSGFFKTFLALFVDECHHAPAKTWEQVIRLTPALFRFGASDTVKDERPEDAVKFYAIRGLLGPVRGSVDTTPLIRAGRSARPHLHIVDVPEWEGRFDEVPQIALPDTPAWCLIKEEWKRGTYRRPSTDPEQLNRAGEPVDLKGFHVIDFPDRGEVDVESRSCLLRRTYDTAVINFKERNELVVAWAKYYSDQGWPTLVVATRSLHILILEELLRRTGVEVRTLVGEDSIERRDDTFSWLVKTYQGKGRVLISPLVKEGVSIPELRAGVVADVVASPDLMRQIIGRFIRKKPTGDNEAHLTLFCDRQYASARRASLKMIQELEKIRGFTFFWPCCYPGQPAQKYEHANFE